jgi:hypothetical protein
MNIVINYLVKYKLWDFIRLMSEVYQFLSVKSRYSASRDRIDISSDEFNERKQKEGSEIHLG